MKSLEEIKDHMLKEITRLSRSESHWAQRKKPRVADVRRAELTLLRCVSIEIGIPFQDIEKADWAGREATRHLTRHLKK